MTGLWITIILECSGQVLELWPILITTQWPQQHPVSSRCWCNGCPLGGEAGWLWFGNLTTNLHFPSTFFAIYLRWTIEPGWCLSSFFCNWMFSNFWNFRLSLYGHSFLHDHYSFGAALVTYQILLKEVMLNLKVVNYSRFSGIFVIYLIKPVMYLAKPHVYLAICCIFNILFFRLLNCCCVFSNFRREF